MLLLVRGLPSTSRYFARVQGEENGVGWSEKDFMLLDVRNAIEALRVMKVNSGRKKGAKGEKFREWENYPGFEAAKRRRQKRKLASWRKMATSQAMKT